MMLILIVLSVRNLRKSSGICSNCRRIRPTPGPGTGNFVAGNAEGNGTDFVAGNPAGNGTDDLKGKRTSPAK